MKKALILLVLLSAIVVPVQAALVFSENFSYPDGGIISNAAGIWIMNSGNAGTMLVSNNQLIVTATPVARTEDIAHQFSPPFATNGTATALYSSFKIMFTGLPTQSGTYFTHFTGDQITFFR